jgi:hypothetical protein
MDDDEDNEAVYAVEDATDDFMDAIDPDRVVKRFRLLLEGP